MNKIVKMKKYFAIVVLLFVSFYNYSQTQQFISIPTTGGTTQPNGTPFQISCNVVNAVGSCTTQTLIINIGKLEYKGTITALNQLNGGIPSSTTDGNGNTTVTISNIPNSGGVSQMISIGAQFKENTCNGEFIDISARTEVCSEQPTQQGVLRVTAGNTINKAKVYFYQESQPNNQTAFCLNEPIKYKLYVTNTDVNPYGYKSGFDVNNVNVKITVPACVNIWAYRAYTYDSSGISITEITAEATQFTKTYILKNVSNSTLDLMTNSGGEGIQGDYYFDVFLRYPCNNGCNNTDPKDVKVSLIGGYCNTSFTKPNEYGGVNNVVLSNVNTQCTFNSCNTTGDEGYRIDYNEYYVKCVESCSPSKLIITVSIPPNSPAYSNKSFTVNIPQGIIVTNATNVYDSSCTTIPNGGIVREYIDVNGQTTQVASQARQIRWTWPQNCSGLVPSFNVLIDFNFVQTAQPTDVFQFNSTFRSGAQTIVSRTENVSPIANCQENYNLYKYVLADNAENDTFSNFSSGLPNDVFTYKLVVGNNSDRAISNAVLEDVIDNRLEYIGNLRYTIGDFSSQDTPTPLVTSGNIPDYGNVTLQLPSNNNNTLRISGLNFSCESRSEYLVFYFDVKMKSNVLAQATIPNSFKVNGFSSTGTSILVGNSKNVAGVLYAKCSSSENWIDSAIRSKTGEVVDFKMKFTNQGTENVLLEKLLNQKPQVGDRFEKTLAPRGSAYTINYNCNSTPVIYKNGVLVSIPGVEFNYSQNSVSTSGALSCPVTNTWTGSCSQSSNWFEVKFPSGFTLGPTETIEVVYKGIVAGNGPADAYNSFSFKLADCGLIPTDSDPVKIINDNLGCDIPQPCSDLDWLTDGTFSSCLTTASTGFQGTFTNGSGWSSILNTPDVRKMPLAYDPSYSINTNIGSVTASDQVFVGAVARKFNNSSYKERFKTTINNLVPGNSYKVEFQQINLTDAAFTGNTVNWKVSFGNQVKYSPALSTGTGAAWTTVTMDFIATSTTHDLIFEGNAPTVKRPWFILIFRPHLFSYVGIDNIKVTSNNPCPIPVPCYDCTSFDLIRNEKYLVSAWVKEEDITKPQQQYKKYENGFVSVSFVDFTALPIGQPYEFYPTGEIIDGWQRIVGEFTVPGNVDDMKLELVNKNTDDNKVVYFDDVRVYPSKGNMKSFVYDQKTQRLMSELDENNYSTFYEYDLEGGLVRIKKETEKGVFTIQETRSGNTKKD